MTESTQPRLAGLGRRPRDRAAERVARPRAGEVPRRRAAHGLDDDGGCWVYEDKRVPDARACRSRSGKRKEEFSPEPGAVLARCGRGCYDPVARARRHGPRRHPRRRCASRRSRASAARSSGRRRTRSSRCLCVQAYNDWMIDEWCGAAPGRFIPLMHHPAVGPGGRGGRDGALRGEGRAPRSRSRRTPSRSACPTIHDPDRYWDPVMAAAQDLEMVVCMHVGLVVDACRRSRPTRRRSRTSPSARSAPRARCSPGCSATSSSACPDLKIALSEGNIGWMPYFIERPSRSSTSSGTGRKNADVAVLRERRSRPAGRWPTSTTSTCAPRFRDHIFGCFIEESSGLRCLDIIGEDNVMIETDYPHTDTTWPDCIDVAQQAARRTCPPETQYKILRGNAERLFRFTPAEPPAAGDRLERRRRDVCCDGQVGGHHRRRFRRRPRLGAAVRGRRRPGASCADVRRRLGQGDGARSSRPTAASRSRAVRRHRRGRRRCGHRGRGRALRPSRHHVQQRRDRDAAAPGCSSRTTRSRTSSGSSRSTSAACTSAASTP